MSFRVEGDLILFNGMVVAQIEPSIWATLRHDVETALDCADLEEHEEELKAEWNDGYDEGFKDGLQGR